MEITTLLLLVIEKIVLTGNLALCFKGVIAVIISPTCFLLSLDSLGLVI